MSFQMPIALRATASWGTRRFTRRRFRTFSYALRYRDGREVTDLNWSECDGLLQGHRYPADTHCVNRGAQAHCPEIGVGQWVDYPYGKPLGD